VDNRRKHNTTQLPAELTDIKRVDSINIITMNEHVDRVLSNVCAQLVFTLKTLRAHGLNREFLHNVFNAVILAKLTYGASAWIGFTRASERERTEAFIRRCVYALNCVLSTQKLLQKCAILTTIGFSTISHVIRTILHQLLPSFSAAAENYNLRACKHNRMLPQRTTRLFDYNFIHRALYSDIY